MDFAWPALKVALEYDRLWHGEPGQFARDRRRLNRLREAGWVAVFVTAEDLRRPRDLVARIALGNRRRSETLRASRCA